MAYHKFLDGKDSQEFIQTLFERAIHQLMEKDEEKLANILKELSKDYVTKVVLIQDTLRYLQAAMIIIRYSFFRHKSP